MKWKGKRTRVRLGQQSENGQKDLRHRQCSTPVILQCVKTDVSLSVDIGVVDAGAELDLNGQKVCERRPSSWMNEVI